MESSKSTKATIKPFDKRKEFNSKFSEFKTEVKDYITRENNLQNSTYFTFCKQLFQGIEQSICTVGATDENLVTFAENLFMIHASLKNVSLRDNIGEKLVELKNTKPLTDLHDMAKGLEDLGLNLFNTSNGTGKERLERLCGNIYDLNI